MKLNSVALKLYLILTENSTLGILSHSVLTFQIHFQVIEEERSSADSQNSFSPTVTAVSSPRYRRPMGARYFKRVFSILCKNCSFICLAISENN